MALDALALKDIKGRQQPEDPAPPLEDIGQRLLAGTMDAMIVFNDPATQCQRSFKINRYIYHDAAKVNDVNLIADETQSALERQFMRHDLKRMERERELQIINMKQHKDNLRELANRKATRPHGKGLTSQELDRLENGDATYVAAERLLAEMDAKIAATRKACGLAE